MAAGRRDARWASRLGWGLAALVLLIADVGTPLLASANGESIHRLVGEVIAATALALPAGVLAGRQPRNAIGWLLLAGALGQALDSFLPSYGKYGVQTHPGSLPLALAVWTAGGVAWWMLMFFSVPLLLMTFPHGRLPSRRWRPPATVLVTLAALSMIGNAFGPGDIGAAGGGPGNPLPQVPVPLLVGTVVLAALWMLVCTVAALAALIRRLRNSSGVERAQYQWFTYGTAVCAGFFALGFVLGTVGGSSELGSDVAVLTGLLAFVTSLTVAMLRYRLFEIGRLVSRTISYTLLTALLAGCYFGLIAPVSALLGRFGTLAVAVSTLVAAAAFNPLRHRLQMAVDRRFNRQRYDAVRTVEGFAQRLRGEIDLDALVTELRGVVQDTLEPADMRLWLRNRPLDTRTN